MIGDMTEENRIANAANLFENTTIEDQVRVIIPNNEPYMEVSFGVENILRFFRFDYVYRLNYRELNTKRWGIRMGITFTL